MDDRVRDPTADRLAMDLRSNTSAFESECPGDAILAGLQTDLQPPLPPTLNLAVTVHQQLPQPLPQPQQFINLLPAQPLIITGECDADADASRSRSES